MSIAWLDLIFLGGGLVLLIKGAQFLITGAVVLAKKWGLSELVIGLTVVAFGTSAPELVINLTARWQGTSDITVGNILGSNIANILLILGLAAIIYPLSVPRQTIWREIPFYFLALGLFVLFVNDIWINPDKLPVISRAEGIILLLIFTAFLLYVIRSGHKAHHVRALAQKKFQPVGQVVNNWWWKLLLGMAGLFIGGQLVINSSVALAESWGWSEKIIGLSIIAIGTTLPELVTSVVAATRKENEIAIGNIVGSNIFNILFVLGLSAVIKPLPMPAGIDFDIGAALVATGILFISLFIGKPRFIERWQGFVLVGLYAFYLFLIWAP